MITTTQLTNNNKAVRKERTTMKLGSGEGCLWWGEGQHTPLNKEEQKLKQQHKQTITKECLRIGR